MIGTVPPSRNIIAIQKSTKELGPLRYDEKAQSLEFAHGPPLEFQSEIKNPQTFQIQPLLLNPDEWFRLEIYTASSEVVSNKTSPSSDTENTSSKVSIYGEVNWFCHIASVLCPEDWALIDPDVKPQWRIPDFLDVDVSHSGWAVYIVVFSTILNLLLLITLAVRAGASRASKFIQAMLFAVAVASSITVSDFIAGWLTEGGSPLSTPLIARILYMLHLAGICVLVLLIVRNRRHRASS